MLADALALPAAVRERAVLAARLHDIGTLAVPELTRPGPRTAEQWAVVRQHPQVGADILHGIPGVGHLAPIVRAHHEHMDGTGYPDRLVGQQIPIEARLVAVCDAWSAITTQRVHNTARTHLDARAELQRCAGSQFDPDIAHTFLGLHDARLVGYPAGRQARLPQVPRQPGTTPPTRPVPAGE